MTPQELEERLRQLGTDWPIPTVSDAVMMSIESQRLPPPRRVSWLRRRATALAGAAAMLAVAVGAVWLFVLAAPTTLQAQMQKSLQKARTAHIVFSSLDDKGVRQSGEIWYERSRGFRAESPDEIILDDGKQQCPDGEREARAPLRVAAKQICLAFHSSLACTGSNSPISLRMGGWNCPSACLASSASDRIIYSKRMNPAQ